MAKTIRTKRVSVRDNGDGTQVWGYEVEVDGLGNFEVDAHVNKTVLRMRDTAKQLARVEALAKKNADAMIRQSELDHAG